MFILNCLPNLEEVELVTVDGIMPAISFEAIKSHEIPELPNLKKLVMSNVNAVTCTAFEKAGNIEELTANLTFKNNFERNLFRTFVINQGKLRVLRNLHRNARINSFIQQVFSSNLKLERIETYPDHHWLLVSLEALTAGPTMTDLKTIVIHGRINAFDIVQILAKSPSLRSFNSENIIWSVRNGLSLF